MFSRRDQPRNPKPVTPAAGQESVWDYPRPPRVEHRTEHIVVTFAGQVIVDTHDSVRVLETSHPPVYYLPIADFAPGVLSPVSGTTFCEFKGRAHYFDIKQAGAVASRAAWTYPDSAPGYEALVERVALYPAQMDSCTIDGEVVQAQEGDFYGGWITSKIVGPFKGAPGTAGW